MLKDTFENTTKELQKAVREGKIKTEKEVKESKHAYQDYDTLAKIASIEDKDLRKRLLNKSNTTENFRQVVRLTKRLPEELKTALLDDKITVEQAKDLSKIHSDKARAQALKIITEHKRKSEIVPKLMEKAKPEFSDGKRRKVKSHKF